MNREQQSRREDLFESGKANRSAFFGNTGTGNPQQGSHYGLPPGQELYGPGTQPPGGNMPVPAQQQEKSSSAPFGLGNLPIKDIKAFVDRMGGIEGIMNTVNKMNSVMKNVQQMAPMIKLLMGSFFKAKTTDSTPSGGGRRRRRRYTSTGYRRRRTTRRTPTRRKSGQRSTSAKRPRSKTRR